MAALGSSRPRPVTRRLSPPVAGDWMPPIEVQVAVAARPEAIDLGFWRTVLGYARMHEDNARPSRA